MYGGTIVWISTIHTCTHTLSSHHITEIMGIVHLIVYVECFLLLAMDSVFISGNYAWNLTLG